MKRLDLKTRCNWIDIARLIGIFLIYVGHYGEILGTAYNWLTSFYVPLFFLLSGMTECFNDRGIIKNLVHKIFTIAIPYLFFGLIYSFYILLTTFEPRSFGEYMYYILKGNLSNPAGLGTGLWFLPTLFVISIAFSIIKKIGNKLIIFVICLALHICSLFVINPIAGQSGMNLLWNTDRVCNYILFFCLGYILFEPVQKIISSDKMSVRILSVLAFIVCITYSGTLYCGHDLLDIMQDINKVSWVVYQIIKPMISIYSVIFISALMQKNTLLGRMGQNSLYLFSNESLIKILLPLFLSAFGLQKQTDTPMQVYVYCAVLIPLVYYILIPVEKPVLDRIIKLEQVITEFIHPQHT